MEIIVEERNNPDNFEKFFDVEAIRSVDIGNGEPEEAFRIDYYNADLRENRTEIFPEWKYRVVMV